MILRYLKRQVIILDMISKSVVKLLWLLVGESRGGQGETFTYARKKMALNKIVRITLAIMMAVFAFVAISTGEETSAQPATAYNADASFSVTAPFSGSGTESSPYLIATRDDLFTLSELINSVNSEYYYDKYYKMTANIDMGGRYDSVSGVWGGYNFLPLGTSYGGVDYYFSGVFDGNGYAVSNLYIQRSSAYVGLFGDVKNGTIKNIGIESGYIEGDQFVGGIAGAVTGRSKIESCYNKAVIKASGSYAGGITGYVGYDSVGVSVVSNCYNAGTIACQRAIIVGGIAGCNDGNINNCFNISIVTGSSPRGAIVGRNYYQNNTGVSVTNVYYNRDVLAQGGTDAATSAVGQSKVTVEDNRLTASKMVTLYGANKPTGMNLPSDKWLFKTPSSESAVQHYYPQQIVMKNDPVTVDVYPNIYTVRFELNGASGSVENQQVREGEYAEEPAQPVRAGYKFIHWSTDVYDRTGGFDFVNTRIVDDTTLYAIWEFKNPVVSISSTGNSVTYGDKVTLTAVVTHGASIVEYAWFKKETSNIPVGTTQSITLSNVSQSGVYFCRVTVKDGTLSKSVTSEYVTVKIAKAVDPVYRIPQTDPVVYFEGIKLGDIALPEGYSWVYPDSSLSATGSGGREYEFIFTPRDTANYLEMRDKAVVYVEKADYLGKTHRDMEITYFRVSRSMPSSLTKVFHGLLRGLLLTPV